MTEQNPISITSERSGCLRGLLLNGALLLVLIGVNLLHGPVSRWQPGAVTGPPGSLLYISTFDAFADEWQQYAGRVRAGLMEGALQIAIEDADRRPFSTTPFRYGDFDLEADMQAVAGPLNNAYGVVFRLQDERNLYRFLISSDGWYSLWRTVDGQDKRLSAWISSPLIVQGLNTVNRVRVVAQGPQMQFFINGQQVQLCIPDDPAGESTFSRGECIGGTMRDTLVDTTFAEGHIGLIAQTLREPGVVVNFEHILIFSPGRESAPQADEQG